MPMLSGYEEIQSIESEHFVANYLSYILYVECSRKNGGCADAKDTGKRQPFWRRGSPDSSRESHESHHPSVANSFNYIHLG